MIKVKNAVILAAGFSSRFVPICFDKPKGLLQVQGETLIERQIRQLKEKGIFDIAVVTGAYAEQYSFLREKHGVTLIHNSDFSCKNNFASLYAARDILSDTLVTSSDLLFKKNIFETYIKHSYYASVFVEGKTQQRSLQLDENDKIIGSQYGGENTWITYGGHAVFSAETSHKLIKRISEVYTKPEWANSYWVDIQDLHLLEIPMYIKRVNQGIIIEFNSLQALREYDHSYNAMADSPTMAHLCQYFDLNNDQQLLHFTPILDGGSPIGCTFEFHGKKYMYIRRNNKIQAML